MQKSKEKSLGQVNTPDRIVSQMLDFGGYKGGVILGKNVIDNSCGDGQFLSEIVRRYIKECLASGKKLAEITDELSQYIHGIEIDEPTCRECRERLTSIAEQFGIEDVAWDIVCDNTLLNHDFDRQMDFVFGNPPYVRVHNVKGSDNYDVLKGYTFAEKGSSDLYLAFYECGLNSLADGGVLCYITPSSWLSSASGKKMREYILANKNLYAVVDFEHTQVFGAAQTYSIITLLKRKANNGKIAYNLYENSEFNPVSALTYDDIVYDGTIRFIPKDYSQTLNDINNCQVKEIRVKNGLATLADGIFIDNLPENFDKDFSIPVLKASTGKWARCFFPYMYTLNGEIESIPLEEIKTYYPSVYSYIIANETALKYRTYDKNSNWWEIGRSQGLSDTFKDKIVVNNLMKSAGDLKIERIPAGSHVYSGFYILTTKPFYTIERALKSEDFFTYVKHLKKYKSGKYYTFSSKDVEKFLNYYVTKKR